MSRRPPSALPRVGAPPVLPWPPPRVVRMQWMLTACPNRLAHSHTRTNTPTRVAVALRRSTGDSTAEYCTGTTCAAPEWPAALARARPNQLPQRAPVSLKPGANACSYTRLHVDSTIAIQSALARELETSCFGARQALHQAVRPADAQALSPPGHRHACPRPSWIPLACAAPSRS